MLGFLLQFSRPVNLLRLQTVLTQPLVGRHILVPSSLRLVDFLNPRTTGGRGVGPCADVGDAATKAAFHIKVRVGFTMLQCSPRIQQR